MKANSATTKSGQFRRADGTPRRVLYAEDQTTSRVVTTAMLKRMGFEVDAVEDGERALEHARHDHYDVILLDIEMPVMDGVTAARSIRSELSHCNGTPILALSAFLADSTEHTKWRDAFDSSVSKPANSNELLNAMTKAVVLKDANPLGLTRLETIKLPAKPTAEEVVNALRGALSVGAWKRLAATAAEEMRHLALSMSACAEADDVQALRHCAHGLKGLALNFGASKVVGLADKLHADATAGSFTELFAEIASWEASNATGISFH